MKHALFLYRRSLFLALFATIISACGNGGVWIDLGVRGTCDAGEVESFSGEDNSWGLEFCADKGKEYTGEARCNEENNLQLKCK